MKEIKVYSSITAGYDKHNNSNNREVFTSYSKFKDPRLNAKIYKVLSHKYVNAKYSIWVDGNVDLNCEPSVLIKMMGDKEILVFKHPDRNCIYKEAEVCKSLGFDSEEIDNQMARYRVINWKEESGLGSCRIIVRKHSQKIEELNNKWWAEINTGSVRDQLSFPIVFNKNIKYVDHPDSYNNEYFTVKSHVKLNFWQRRKKHLLNLIG